MIVKITQRHFANRISLYLETHRGKGGRVKLQQWLYPKPKTEAQKSHNKQALIVANAKLAEAQADAMYAGTNLPVPHRLQSSVYEYMLRFAEAYKKSDVRKVWATLKLWQEFEAGSPIYFQDINTNVIDDFKNHLIEKLSSETSRAYLSKLKTILKRARVDRYLSYDIKNYEGTIPTRRRLAKETLEPEEVQLLATTHCDAPTVKLAFLFCCYTGLDFTDCFHLTWKEHINGDRMKKPRKKTDIDRHTPLHQTAVEILNLLDRQTKFVFAKLPNRQNVRYSNDASNKTLLALVKRAGINKHITWHCARHTFGTLLEGDETTVANLLGHSDTKMVKVYRRAKDERLKKSVESLKGVTISG